MNSYNCCYQNAQEYEQIANLSSLLKLVGEESRLKLLCLLKQKEHCVCEIIEHFDMSQSLISHHLSDLKRAGLVKNRKQGRQVHYYLTTRGKSLTNKIFSLGKEVV